MEGIIAEIDEVDLQKAPKRKANDDDFDGFFAKAVYPARPLSVICLREFDCATDVMDGEDKINTVRWVSGPQLPTDEYQRPAFGQSQNISGGILKQVLKLKALERCVNGTGNEGSEAYFLFRHAALLVPLKNGAERELEAFSHEHAQRG